MRPACSIQTAPPKFAKGPSRTCRPDRDEAPRCGCVAAVALLLSCYDGLAPSFFCSCQRACSLLVRGRLLDRRQLGKEINGSTEAMMVARGGGGPPDRGGGGMPTRDWRWDEDEQDEDDDDDDEDEESDWQGPSLRLLY